MFRLDQGLENRQQDQVDGEVGDRAQLLVVEGEQVGQEDGREYRPLEPAQGADSRAEQQIDQSDQSQAARDGRGQDQRQVDGFAGPGYALPEDQRQAGNRSTQQPQQQDSDRQSPRPAGAKAFVDPLANPVQADADRALGRKIGRALGDRPSDIAQQACPKAAAAAKPLLQLIFLGWIEVVQRRVLEQHQRIRQVGFLGPGAVPLERAPPEKQQHEDDVDQSDCRAVEVVVVAGDEFPQLVDEQSEANPAHHGGGPPNPVPQVAEQDQEGGDHEPSTPEHVGDVKAATAQPGEPGQPQEEAHRQQGGNRRYQEPFEQLPGTKVADEKRTRGMVVHAHRRRIYGFAAPVGLGDTVPISSRTLSIRISARKASGASWSRAVIANGLAAARITDRAATTRPATWTHPTWSIVAATENTAVDMNRAASTRSSTTVSAKASLGVGLVNARTMGGTFVASSVSATRMAPTSSQRRRPAPNALAKARKKATLSTARAC